MNNKMIRNLALMGLMLAAAVLAPMMQATNRLADQLPPIQLETMIPHEFGGWRDRPELEKQVVDPEVQSKLDTLYGQILARTYENKNGARMMLSIAYGTNQGSNDFQVHRPEYCYTSQGFQVGRGFTEALAYKQGALLVQRLKATQGQRHEPITYWITIGDKATLPGMSRKLTQLSYGLSGNIPDGMLIRVSSIDKDTSKQYLLQDQFIKAMLDAIEPGQRQRMTGTL